MDRLVATPAVSLHPCNFLIGVAFTCRRNGPQRRAIVTALAQVAICVACIQVRRGVPIAIVGVVVGNEPVKFQRPMVGRDFQVSLVRARGRQMFLNQVGVNELMRRPFRLATVWECPQGRFNDSPRVIFLLIGTVDRPGEFLRVRYDVVGIEVLLGAFRHVSCVIYVFHLEGATWRVIAHRRFFKEDDNKGADLMVPIPFNRFIGTFRRL